MNRKRAGLPARPSPAEFAHQILQADVEQYESYARAETGQLSEQDKEGIAAMELRIQLEQDRLDRLAERRLLLENDLTAAQRRLSSIESILDAWLDKLE